MISREAAELQPGRGHAQIHGGNQWSEWAGEEGDKQPTHSPLLQAEQLYKAPEA